MLIAAPHNSFAMDSAPTKPLPPRLAVAGLLLLASLLLVPFVKKAFHVDDPLFLWTARQIHSRPFDFYGFNVNWYGYEMPMSKVTMNPPLAAYYIAAITALFGWRELTLHIAFLLPALVTVLGFYRLAREFCSRPGLAALCAMLSPPFILSSTSLG
jgi:4-amino-4-deoxy-L-arabinose transferase-like glycosyltransferase